MPDSKKSLESVESGIWNFCNLESVESLESLESRESEITNHNSEINWSAFSIGLAITALSPTSTIGR